MADSQRWALIGDSNVKRFEIVERILLDEFLTNCVRVSDYEGLRHRLNERKWNLILIAHDLPQTAALKTARLRDYFSHLSWEAPDEAARACIVDASEPEGLASAAPPPHRIHIVSTHPTLEQRKQIATEIGGIISRAPRLPAIVLKRSRSLQEQVRALSKNRALNDGKAILAHLIRNFFEWESATIAPLGQGLSGAAVFRISKTNEDDPVEFILKLAPIEDLWKVKLEIERYEEAKTDLGVEDYAIHFPKLLPARVPFERQTYTLNNVAENNSGWCAICYDFIGGDKFGTLVDLATVLINSSEELIEKTRGTPFELPVKNAAAVQDLRIRLFTAAINWLCQSWYMKSDSPHRETTRMWDTRDTPAQQYPAMPPYRLSGKSKGFILSFLDSDLSRIGESMLEGWNDCRNRVWSLVDRTRGPARVFSLDQDIPVVLSPVHGDLNANNMLLWLDKEDYPFLIDFPFFQKQGHALQDFARLEVEIKFAIMDRQMDTKNVLPAFDYTSSQLLLWKELEDHLRSKKWQSDKSVWNAAGVTSNVDFCLRLVQFVRSKAMEVQQHGANRPKLEFMEEYAPALIFHTIRAIGYNSLSVFKRLLAVYSAGSMLSI